MKQVAVLFHLIFYGFLALSTLNAMGISHSYLELLSHFSLFFFLASCFFLVTYGFFRKWRHCVAALFIAGITAFPLIQMRLPSPSISSEVIEEFSLLQFNIYYENREPDSVIQYVRHLNYPEVVVIHEASEGMAQALRPLKREYPYVYEKVWGECYGTLILSRFPIKKSEEFSFKTGGNYAVVSLQTHQQSLPIHLMELHAISPLRDILYGHTQRQEQLAEASRVMEKIPGPYRLLVGDLNTTPFSPFFQELLKVSKLKNGMQGLRSEGTWHSLLPSFFRFPIDHLLVSTSISVRSQKILPALGSDHLPVLSRIQLHRPTSGE